MATATAGVKLVAEGVSQFETDLKTAQGAVDGLDRSLDGVSTGGGGIAVLGTVGKVAAGGLAVVAAGAGAATAGLVSATKEAMAAEQVMATLESVLASTGAATGVTAELANSLAEKWSTLTMFDDESILGGEAVLARFKEIGATVFPQATDAMLDLATAMGTDVETAATTLGKALATPGEGLLRLKAAGVVFTDEETKMLQSMTEAGQGAEAQKIILDRLASSIGTTAEAAGATATGQWTIFNNQIGNVKETIGAAFLPALTTLGTKLTEALSKPEVQAAISNLATALGDLATKALPPLVDFLTNTLIPALVSVAQFLGGGGEGGGGLSSAFAGVTTFIQPVIDALGPFIEALTGLWNLISPVLIPALEALGNVLTNVILPLFGEQLMTAIQTIVGVLSGFITTLTGIINTIVGLATGDMQLVNQGVQQMSDGMLGIFTSLVDGITQSMTNLVNAVVGIFTQFGVDIATPVQAVIDSIVATFTGLPDSVSAIATDAATGFTDVFTQLQEDIGDVIDGIITEITDTFEGVVDTITGIGEDIINGFLGGLSDAWNLGKGIVTDIASGLESLIRGPTETQSPSMMTYRIGQDLMEGLRLGIERSQFTLEKTISDTIGLGLRHWFSEVLGPDTRNKIMEGADAVLEDFMVRGTETYQEALTRIVKTLVAGFNPMVQQLALQNLPSLFKYLGDMIDETIITPFQRAQRFFSIAGVFGTLGLTATTRMKTQSTARIAALQDELLLLDDQTTALGEQQRILEEIEAERQKITAAEEAALQLQEQQQQLQFLQQQAELLEIIRKYNLNPAEILGGIQLGLGADLTALTAAMIRAMNAMAQGAQGIIGMQHGGALTVPPGYPRDNYRIGVSSGERVVITPAGMAQAAGVSVTFGEVNITNGMDLQVFKALVIQTVRQASRV